VVAAPGHRPGIDEAVAKLELLRARGATEEAFTFATAFPPPDAPEAPVTFSDQCPAV
jgi:Domain of unknown function (DUF3291)